MRLYALWNLTVSLALAPGILGHEYSHYLACRLFGVEVTGGSYLNPFAENAYVDHERVESFVADVGIAFAPLVLNTVLGVAAFLVASAWSSPLSYVPLWAGVCLAFTAFPTEGDTRSLTRTAGNLPSLVRPLGYAVAGPVRVLTYSPWLSGFYGYVYVLALYAAT